MPSFKFIWVALHDFSQTNPKKIPVFWLFWQRNIFGTKFGSFCIIQKRFGHNWIKDGHAVRFYFWALFANLYFLNFIACAIVQCPGLGCFWKAEGMQVSGFQCLCLLLVLLLHVWLTSYGSTFNPRTFTYLKIFKTSLSIVKELSASSLLCLFIAACISTQDGQLILLLQL